MSSCARLVLVFAALALTALVWLALVVLEARETGARGELDVAPERPLAAAAELTAPDAVRARAAAEPEPSALPSAAPHEAAAVEVVPAEATLQVLVLWAGEAKEPAAGVRVELSRRYEDELFDKRALVTDARGIALFEGLVPGRAHVSAWRGDVPEFARVELVAGTRTEHTLQLEVGVRLRGRVIDERASPVPGAEVLVAGWAGGEAQVLAITDHEGRFDLRSLATHCHVGARAAGYAATPLLRSTASEGAEVDVVIRLVDRAAELNGVVFDSAGSPVANAVVRAGSTEQAHRDLPDGTSAMGPREVFARTDAEGRFRFAHLSIGEVPLAVRARELAPWQQTITTRAEGENFVIVQLERGAVLHGTVRDDAGAGLAGVEIRCGAWEDLGLRRVRSGEGGAYRITGIAPGELAVHIEDEKHGRFATTALLSAGAETQLDPVLSNGLVQKGRVLDENGEPRKSVMIEASEEKPETREFWHAFDNTDEQGRFELRNMKPGRAIRLSFRRESVFPELVMRDLMPSESELVVRLPAPHWIWIQGSVVGPDGAVLANVDLSPYMSGGNGSPAETADPKTGAFKLGPYPPGEYSLSIHAAGFERLKIPARRLEPNEVWDLGVVKLAP